jgi:hypothetical protein
MLFSVERVRPKSASQSRVVPKRLLTKRLEIKDIAQARFSLASVPSLQVLMSLFRSEKITIMYGTFCFKESAYEPPTHSLLSTFEILLPLIPELLRRLIRCWIGSSHELWHLTIPSLATMTSLSRDANLAWTIRDWDAKYKQTLISAEICFIYSWTLATIVVTQCK